MHLLPSLAYQARAKPSECSNSTQSTSIHKHQLNRAAETDGFGYTFWPQQFLIINHKRPRKLRNFPWKGCSHIIFIQPKKECRLETILCIQLAFHVHSLATIASVSARACWPWQGCTQGRPKKSFAKSSRLPRRIDEWKQVRNELTSGARIKAKVSDTCTQRSDVSQQVKDCLRCKMFTIWVENQNLGLKWGSGRYNFNLARSFCPFVNYKDSHWMRSIILFICFISSSPW